MKITHHSWYCIYGHKNDGDSRSCWICDSNKYERFAQVRSQDRAVIYHNPATGERRTPARADQPVPEIYARQGFERLEIESMVTYEKQAGVVHEATNFYPGNEPGPEERKPYKPTREAIQAVIEDFQAAKASGPFTGFGIDS